MGGGETCEGECSIGFFLDALNELNESDLTCLDISNTIIIQQDLEKLALRLANDRKIKQLIIRDSIYLNLEGYVKKIALALPKNLVLEALDFSGSNIGVEGASAIMEAISRNKNYVEVNFDKTLFKDHATNKNFMELVEKVAHLSRLSLTGCGSIEFFANALQENKSITELALGDVVLFDNEITAVASLLEKNQHLRRLTLTKYHLTGKKNFTEIATALTKNQHLRALRLIGEFNEEEITAFALLLKQFNISHLEFDLITSSNDQYGIKNMIRLEMSEKLQDLIADNIPGSFIRRVVVKNPTLRLTKTADANCDLLDLESKQVLKEFTVAAVDLPYELITKVVSYLPSTSALSYNEPEEQMACQFIRDAFIVKP